MRHCRGQFCHLVPARILSVRIPGTFFAMYKNHLLKGALLLTAAGVFSRIIGFFYRIFLSRTFGAEQMGIYELISPVLALSFALCTSAIQSSISKFTAAEPEAAIYAKHRILLTGLSVSFVLSCLCTLFVWREADFISDFLLKETRCAPLLKIAALSFPAACIHSCINGYYYGIRKMEVQEELQKLTAFLDKHNIPISDSIKKDIDELKGRVKYYEGKSIIGNNKI